MHKKNYDKTFESERVEKGDVMKVGGEAGHV